MYGNIYLLKILKTREEQKSFNLLTFLAIMLFFSKLTYFGYLKTYFMTVLPIPKFH